MKILHISGAKGWGGNEQQMMHIIPELIQLGVENVVFGVNDSVLQKECETKNIPFIEAKKSKLNKFANYSYLKTIVKKIKPDIIHLHTSDSLTVFTISDLIFGLSTKAVFSKKGMGASSSFLSRFKYNYSGINSIICVSKRVESDFSLILSPKNKPKTTVIHDCVSLNIEGNTTEINLRNQFSIPDKNFIVGNIANHSAAKDLFTLIEVVDYLVNVLNRKEVCFVQIGEFSKLTDSILERVKEKNLEKNIFFTDKIPNAIAFNSQFDVFLMTSQREGGPTSVLEAMLMGVPVVSTDVGVLPDVITNGINGFLSPVKDYIDIAKKLDLLLSDKMMQKRFAEISKSKIYNEFGSLFLAKQTLAEYEKINSL